MRSLLILLSALLITAYAQNASDPAVVATVTTTNPPVTTTVTTLSPTTTTAPTSSAVTTTTTAAAAATTTTTTTTAAAPTSSGTGADGVSTQSSTSSNPPVTTSVPVTPPTPVIGSWSLTDPTNNLTCFKIDVAMEIVVIYEAKNDLTENYTVTLFPNDTLTGECIANDTVPQTSVQVTFELKEAGFDTSYLTMIFEHDGTYGLTTMIYRFNQAPDALISGQATANATELQKIGDADYTIDYGASYVCDSLIPINFTEASAGIVAVQANVKHFRYQAFKAGDKYNTERHCGADFGTSDIVPIAVGCALAGLVLIVLVAYLIGRRRSRQKGYQSV
ncbi:Lysosome-associated membrane glycoprotein 1 [Chamberlinius hualienensis]